MMIIIIINDPTISTQGLRGIGRNWRNCMTLTQNSSRIEVHRIEESHHID
jgi:hypothetical protein